MRNTILLCEASGGYEGTLLAFCHRHHLPVASINARQVRDYARARGILAKTDAIDARILADYARTFDVAPQTPPDNEDIRAIQRRREQLVALLRQEKAYREQLRHPDLIARNQRHQDWLKQEIQELDAMLEEQIHAHAELGRKQDILTSCKGLGRVTANAIIAELPELGTMSHANISALVGVAPINHDSGAMRGKRAIAGGRQKVRDALYSTSH